MSATLDLMTLPESLPRCYVLDESHHVILVCTPNDGHALHRRFVPDPKDTTLPYFLGHAVTALKAACAQSRRSTITAAFGKFNIRVNLLHGRWGQHTAVVVAPVRGT